MRRLGEQINFVYWGHLKIRLFPLPFLRYIRIRLCRNQLDIATKMKLSTLIVPVFGSLIWCSYCEIQLSGDPYADIPAGECQPEVDEWKAGARRQSCAPNNPCLVQHNGCILRAQWVPDANDWLANCSPPDPSNTILGTQCHKSGWEGTGNCGEYNLDRCDELCGKHVVLPTPYHDLANKC
ncbi:hypothetical protein EJ03DRAFT_40113 [Teratosphaeria nubilosa]|uniref:Uncharacterized protein n=1 Tax=Teratosphaeria nubilosa TaxID=161662 RepID=A0A6G1KU47_9PEZI|nr:hypothetical protein EJ03DRAFT_40113 [Teratosphaeria nubilosa]